MSFEPSEPEAYFRDVPNAEVDVLEAGHFALDTAAGQIAEIVRRFMSRGGDAVTQGAVTGRSILSNN